MNNIEQNALRIAELMGWEYNPVFNSHTKNCVGFLDAVQIKDNNELIDKFSSYQGLMPLVFECNRSSINPNVSIHINDVQVWIMQDDEYVINPLNYVTETEFIQAIQECVIKYLELKNE